MLLINNNQSNLSIMEKNDNQAFGNKYEEFSGEIRVVGSWSFHQNLLYVIFLQKNKLIMVSKKKRRNVRIFERMSKFISTRNSLQCRSHHQKMFQKFGDVKNIISNFKKYIGKEQYKSKIQQLFGPEKTKEETRIIPQKVKEQAFSEVAQQLPIKVQDNPYIQIIPEVQEFQKIYSLYLAQFANQPNSYSILSLYYSGFQSFP